MDEIICRKNIHVEQGRRKDGGRGKRRDFCGGTWHFEVLKKHIFTFIIIGKNLNTWWYSRKFYKNIFQTSRTRSNLPKSCQMYSWKKEKEIQTQHWWTISHNTREFIKELLNYWKPTSDQKWSSICINVKIRLNRKLKIQRRFNLFKRTRKNIERNCFKKQRRFWRFDITKRIKDTFEHIQFQTLWC